MKSLTLIARILLGAGFTVFGLNILFGFIPMPPPLEGSLAAQFMAIMGPSKWMALVGIFQVMGGVLVLSGRLLPLGLVILGPILVNILAFHFFLESGKGVGAGLFFSALEIFLIFANRRRFQPILSLH